MFFAFEFVQEEKFVRMLFAFEFVQEGANRPYGGGGAIFELWSFPFRDDQYYDRLVCPTFLI